MNHVSYQDSLITNHSLKATEPLTEIRQADGEEKDSAGAIYGRSGSVMQRTMSFLEDELWTLLEDSRSHISDSKSLKTKHPSFNSKEKHYRCPLLESGSTGDDEYPTFPPEVVASMKKIVMAIISTGYETECCQVFGILSGTPCCRIQRYHRELIPCNNKDSACHPELRHGTWPELDILGGSDKSFSGFRCGITTCPPLATYRVNRDGTLKLEFTATSKYDLNPFNKASTTASGPYLEY